MQIEHLEVSLQCMVRRATFPGWNIPPRRIIDHEMVYILSGEGEITIREHKYHVQKGDIIFFRPGILHSLSANHEPYMEFYGVHFTLPEQMNHLPIPDIMKLEVPHHLNLIFKELYDVYRKKPDYYCWRQNLLLQQILYEIFAQISQKNQPIEQIRIRKVLNQIHENPMQHFSMEAMMQTAGIQKTQFLKSFKNVTGSSPLQYIVNLRLEYSRELLLETKLPISIIAEKSGFSDTFYFSRCFKKKYKSSPLKYRIQYYTMDPEGSY